MTVPFDSWTVRPQNSVTFPVVSHSFSLVRHALDGCILAVSHKCCIAAAKHAIETANLEVFLLMMMWALA
jgi:hypothetical protein